MNEIAGLINLVEKLKNSDIRKVVEQRIREFESIPRDFNSLFRELTFCILTAGTSAELGIKTINHLGDTIFTESEEEIQKRLKEVYRFHTIRAGYIFQARKSFRKIDINSKNVRELLVENIKGLGMKETSHFLRNVGFKNFAIIDFHIIDILVKYGLIDKPKTLTKNKYFEIEDVLKEIARKTDLSLAELDLYLWHEETGKVLK
jgi:N-glycosylase/DNA lyase